MHKVSICGRSVVIVDSFVEGGRLLRLEPKPRQDDDAIMAEALRIQRRQGKEAAEMYLDLWALHKHPASRN